MTNNLNIPSVPKLPWQQVLHQLRSGDPAAIQMLSFVLDNMQTGLEEIRGGDLKSGNDGADGNKIHTGIVSDGGSPPAGVGNLNDLFYSNDGRWWVKTTNGWAFQGTLTGPAGIDGSSADVARWFPFTYGFPYSERRTGDAQSTSGGAFALTPSPTVINWANITEMRFNYRDANGIPRDPFFRAGDWDDGNNVIGIRDEKNEITIGFKVLSAWTYDSSDMSYRATVERYASTAFDQGNPSDLVYPVGTGEEIFLLMPFLNDFPTVDIKRKNPGVYRVFLNSADQATQLAARYAMDPVPDWPASAVALANSATPGNNLSGDVVTLYRGSYTETRAWDPTQNKWILFDGWIGGNIVANGSILGNKISANTADILNLAIGHELSSRNFNGWSYWWELINRFADIPLHVNPTVSVPGQDNQPGDGGLGTNYTTSKGYRDGQTLDPGKFGLMSAKTNQSSSLITDLSPSNLRAAKRLHFHLDVTGRVNYFKDIAVGDLITVYNATKSQWIDYSVTLVRSGTAQTGYYWYWDLDYVEDDLTSTWSSSDTMRVSTVTPSQQGGVQAVTYNSGNLTRAGTRIYRCLQNGTASSVSLSSTSYWALIDHWATGQAVNMGDYRQQGHSGHLYRAKRVIGETSSHDQPGATEQGFLLHEDGTIVIQAAAILGQLLSSQLGTGIVKDVHLDQVMADRVPGINLPSELNYIPMAFRYDRFTSPSVLGDDAGEYCLTTHDTSFDNSHISFTNTDWVNTRRILLYDLVSDGRSAGPYIKNLRQGDLVRYRISETNYFDFELRGTPKADSGKTGVWDIPVSYLSRQSPANYTHSNLAGVDVHFIFQPSSVPSYISDWIKEADNAKKLTKVSADLVSLAGIENELTALSTKRSDLLLLAGVRPDLQSLAGDRSSIDDLLGDKSNIDILLGKQADLVGLATAKSQIDSLLGSKSSIDSLLGSKSAIDSLLGSKSSIDSLLGSKSSIDSLLAKRLDLLAIAGQKVDIATLVNEKTDLVTLASKLADLTALAQQRTKLVALAGQQADLLALAAQKTDILRLEAKQAELLVLAAVSTKLKALADIEAGLKSLEAEKTDLLALTGSDFSALASITTKLKSLADIETGLKALEAEKDGILKLETKEPDLTLLAGERTKLMTVVTGGAGQVQTTIPGKDGQPGIGGIGSNYTTAKGYRNATNLPAGWVGLMNHQGNSWGSYGISNLTAANLRGAKRLHFHLDTSARVDYFRNAATGDFLTVYNASKSQWIDYKITSIRSGTIGTGYYWYWDLDDVEDNISSTWATSDTFRVSLGKPSGQGTTTTTAANLYDARAGLLQLEARKSDILSFVGTDLTALTSISTELNALVAIDDKLKALADIEAGLKSLEAQKADILAIEAKKTDLLSIVSQKAGIDALVQQQSSILAVAAAGSATVPGGTADVVAQWSVKTRVGDLVNRDWSLQRRNEHGVLHFC